MANKFLSNSARSACGIKTCKTLPAFVSKELKQEIIEHGENLDRLWAERVKWDDDKAEAEVARLRNLLENDPSSKNIAAVSAESTEELRKRYATTRDRIASAYNAVKNKGHDLMLKVLSGLEREIWREIDLIESEHQATAERYGIPYNREEDMIIKGLARLADNARARLDNERCVQATSDLREFIGDLKTPGLFS